MTKNVGKTDRIIRIVLGVILLCLGIYFKKWWLDLIGAAALITGLTSWCGLYKVIGVSTCKVK